MVKYSQNQPNPDQSLKHLNQSINNKQTTNHSHQSTQPPTNSNHSNLYNYNHQTHLTKQQRIQLQTNNYATNPTKNESNTEHFKPTANLKTTTLTIKHTAKTTSKQNQQNKYYSQTTTKTTNTKQSNTQNESK